MSRTTLRRHRRSLAAGAAATLAAATLAVATPAATAAPGGDLAPLVGTRDAAAIDGRYIVVLEDQVSARSQGAARSQAVSAGGRVTHEYTSAIRGFAAELPPKALEAVRKNPNVAYVEADRPVSISADQANPTWGLDRIDQRSLPLDARYGYTQDGTGVRAYVIDTGVRASHQEFGGRVVSGYTAVSDGNGTNDCNGHGTHVAGTVGGSTYGVAKAVTIVPVRVLDCEGSGTNAGVIAGVDWVTSNHAAGAPAVANMSLGGGASTALDDAVERSISDGVTYAVAAGNDYGADACSGSPSRVPAALTVGSTTRTDARSSFSNIGSCLDLFAPGSDITSAWHTSNSATSTISGTSMATPHVAGVAALHLDADPTASPSEVAGAIVGGATSGTVTNPGSGSPNRLLYSVPGTTAPPEEPEPPTGSALVNPGFESGATGWTSSAGVIDNSSGAPARTGSWKAWLNGYGTTRSDNLAQAVTVPSGATLRFWLRVSSAETTTTTAYDRLQVQVSAGGTTRTLATYSNLHETSGYVQRSVSLSAYAGQRVTIRFVGSEDSSLATSFLVDDTSLG